MFDSVPTPVKLIVGVLVAVVLLAVLAPVVKAIVDAVLILVGITLVLGGGYLTLRKLNS